MDKPIYIIKDLELSTSQQGVSILLDFYLWALNYNYKSLILDLSNVNHIDANLSILYRYKRVESLFHNLLNGHLLQHFDEINVFTIGQQGGGINRNELLKAIKNK